MTKDEKVNIIVTLSISLIFLILIYSQHLHKLDIYDSLIYSNCTVLLHKNISHLLKIAIVSKII